MHVRERRAALSAAAKANRVTPGRKAPLLTAGAIASRETPFPSTAPRETLLPLPVPFMPHCHAAGHHRSMPGNARCSRSRPPRRHKRNLFALLHAEAGVPFRFDFAKSQSASALEHFRFENAPPNVPDAKRSETEAAAPPSFSSPVPPQFTCGVQLRRRRETCDPEHRAGRYFQWPNAPKEAPCSLFILPFISFPPQSSA